MLQAEKFYIGSRADDGVLVLVGDGALHWGALPPRYDLARHSHGFEFGYEGAGPAQLALAMLADATDDDALAVRYHEAFKRACVARLDNGFRVKATAVRSWLECYLRTIGNYAPAMALDEHF